MKKVEDLTDRLRQKMLQNTFYYCKARIKKLLAMRTHVRDIRIKEAGWGKREIKEEKVVKAEDELKPTPIVVIDVREGKEKILEKGCFTFPKVDGKVVIPIGGPYGLIKSSMRRAAKLVKARKFLGWRLGLVKIYPEWGYAGPWPPDSMMNGNLPEKILRPVAGPGRKRMVADYHDYIVDRDIEFIIEISSESPVSEDEVIAAVKSLNDLDEIGPCKRGRIYIYQITKVSLSPEEKRNLWTYGWINPAKIPKIGLKPPETNVTPTPET